MVSNTLFLPLFLVASFSLSAYRPKERAYLLYLFREDLQLEKTYREARYVYKYICVSANRGNLNTKESLYNHLVIHWLDFSN